MHVTIIGAGVVGLCCASELLRAGHSVLVVASRRTPCTQSDRAGAIWLPLLNCAASERPADYESRLAEWSRRSWSRLITLSTLDAGVRLIRNHELFRARSDPPDYLAEILPELEVTDDDRLPAGFVFRWSFRTLAIETPRYMPWLERRCLDLGAVIRRGNLVTIDEVKALPGDVVVNCSGLGSWTLFGDEGMRPVRGQLLLHDPVPLDEAFGSDEFGVLPRADGCMLGSLFQDGLADERPSPADTDHIWQEISRWQRVADDAVGLPRGVLRRSGIRAVTAGVRPFRAGGVRLEIASDLGTRALVHNYGHGGSGFTLSWGCAEEVAALVGSL